MAGELPTEMNVTISWSEKQQKFELVKAIISGMAVNSNFNPDKDISQAIIVANKILKELK